MAAIVQASEAERSGFTRDDFEHTAQLLTGENKAIVEATLSNNFNIILAALRTAADAERDYADMRRMQAQFISADQERRAALDALRPFASPPLYVFNAEVQYVPTRQPDDWIGGGWVSTSDYQRAKDVIAASSRSAQTVADASESRSRKRCASRRWCW